MGKTHGASEHGRMRIKKLHISSEREWMETEETNQDFVQCDNYVYVRIEKFTNSITEQLPFCNLNPWQRRRVKRNGRKRRRKKNRMKQNERLNYGKLL